MLRSIHYNSHRGKISAFVALEWFLRGSSLMNSAPAKRKRMVTVVRNTLIFHLIVFITPSICLGISEKGLHQLGKLQEEYTDRIDYKTIKIPSKAHASALLASPFALG